LTLIDRLCNNPQYNPPFGNNIQSCFRFKLLKSADDAHVIVVGDSARSYGRQAVVVVTDIRLAHTRLEAPEQAGDLIKCNGHIFNYYHAKRLQSKLVW